MTIGTPDSTQRAPGPTPAPAKRSWVKWVALGCGALIVLAACFAALRKLRASGKIDIGERVVIFNTGSGIKYLDSFEGS